MHCHMVVRLSCILAVFIGFYDFTSFARRRAILTCNTSAYTHTRHPIMTLRRVVAGTWTVVDTRDGGCFSSILFCFFASFCPNVLACGVGWSWWRFSEN